MAATSPRRAVCLHHSASGHRQWANISPAVTLPELLSLVASMFNLGAPTTSSPWHLEYTDMDGDVVRIANDVELQEALTHLPDQACELVVKVPMPASWGQWASMTWQTLVPVVQQAFHEAELATLAFLDQDGMGSPRPRPARRPHSLQPDSDTEPETDDDDE